jgi:membrane protein DedA with SNARE-associated domain/rhodanese-related sulfurtransferase
METLVSGLHDHGYLFLCLVVFLEAIGIPIPAALALLMAGGASATGTMQVLPSVGGAIAAMMLADTLMFLLGRYTGWWLLGAICRLSLNPETCILRSADSFYRRGRKLLLLAKFIPGIATMAPPLAGSMNMRPAEFFRFDLGGVAIYIVSYFFAGYAFSGILETVLKGYRAFGHILGIALGLAALSYFAIQVWTWRRSLRRRFRLYVSPAEAFRASSAGIAVIFDVRSHGYYDHRAKRIQGSRRLDPNALNQPGNEFPEGKRIYLYCTCLRDATSGRVAQELREKGTICAVIEGGLRAWKKARLPLEPIPADELTPLPVFGR